MEGEQNPGVEEAEQPRRQVGGQVGRQAGRRAAGSGQSEQQTVQQAAGGPLHPAQSQSATMTSRINRESARGREARKKIKG